jgi:hypothetical protein
MADIEGKGVININTFNKIVHQFKVYLSREELKKIELSYGSGVGSDLDYLKLS